MLIIIVNSAWVIGVCLEQGAINLLTKQSVLTAATSMAPMVVIYSKGNARNVKVAHQELSFELAGHRGLIPGLLHALTHTLR